MSRWLSGSVQIHCLVTPAGPEMLSICRPNRTTIFIKEGTYIKHDKTISITAILHIGICLLRIGVVVSVIVGIVPKHIVVRRIVVGGEQEFRVDRPVVAVLARWLAAIGEIVSVTKRYAETIARYAATGLKGREICIVDLARNGRHLCCRDLSLLITARLWATSDFTIKKIGRPRLLVRPITLLILLTSWAAIRASVVAVWHWFLPI